MRRTTAILTACLCAIAGCRGGAAQEPYDGVIARTQRPERPPATASAQATEAQPIASEADAPWTIALLSNAKVRPAKRATKVIVVDVTTVGPEAAVPEIDMHLAIDPGATDDKAATLSPESSTASGVTPKRCNGVVNRRS